MLHLELSRHSGSIAGKPAVKPASAIGPRSHGQCWCGERTRSICARIGRACGRFGARKKTVSERDCVKPAAIVVAHPVGESSPSRFDPLRFDRALLITPSASSGKRAASTKHGAGTTVDAELQTLTKSSKGNCGWPHRMAGAPQHLLEIMLRPNRPHQQGGNWVMMGHPLGAVDGYRSIAELFQALGRHATEWEFFGHGRGRSRTAAEAGNRRS